MKTTSIYINLFFACLFTFISCSEKGQTIPSDPALTDLIKLQEGKWHEKDVNGIVSFYAESFIRHDPRNGMTEDKESLKKFIKVVFEEYPDFSLKLNEVKMIGNETFANYTLSGTNTGLLGKNIPGTGKKVSFEALIHSFWESGKITKEYVFYDRLALVQQLGFQIKPPVIDDFSEACR